MGLNVFITGASSGIGAAFAREYARQGAILGLVARKRDALGALAAECGPNTLTYSADVADGAALKAAAQDFMTRHGTTDIVIANAGISVGTLGSMEEDVAILERVLKTNVVGLAATTQPFIAAMVARGAGALVVIGSVAGYRGLPGSGAYCASKSAAITWAEALRVELHGSGVRVTTICPGYIDTRMTQGNQYPMPFLLSPEKFAARAARAIAVKRRYIVIPWQMGMIGWLLNHTPRWLFDRVFAKAGRKARNLPT